MDISFPAVEHIVWHGPLIGKVRAHLEGLEQDHLVQMLDKLETSAVVRFSSEVGKGPDNPVLPDDMLSLMQDFSAQTSPPCNAGQPHNRFAITPAGLNELVDTIGVVLHETGAEKTLCGAYDQFVCELKGVNILAVHPHNQQRCLENEFLL